MNRIAQRRTKLIIGAGILSLILGGGAAIAQRVDQGAPGAQGPWPVLLSGSPTLTVNVNPAAQTSGTQAEVLVLNSASTAVPTTPLSGRRAVEIQNLGPNTIYCNVGGGAAVITKSRAITTQSAWALEIGSAITVACKAGTADQVTGAATIVTELK